MNADREIIEKLIDKIDELLVVLNGIVEDLRSVSASLKSYGVSQPPRIAPPSMIPPETYDRERKTELEDIKMMFPEDLESLLNFEDRGEFIVVKPRQFLGSENFAKIASIARGMGGDYISAGKDSHFRIPKKKA
ncbi:MAG: hypothetical protein QXN87_09085 [Candidatus Bathyarchaeia archaeon]